MCPHHCIIINNPQTTYNRFATFPNDAERDNEEKQSIDNVPSESFAKGSSNKNRAEAPSYLSQLKIWNGIYSNVNIMKIFLRPFPFLLSPVVRR